MGDHASQAGHNATDITLVIGAMDLLYSGVRHFCLVTGDSDYVPLVRRLRQWGCEVLVLGRSSASATLMKEASQFYSLEELALRPVPSSAADMFALPSDPPSLAEMLTKAYRAIAQHDSTEWVSYSDLGTTVRQLYPNLYELYGKHPLSSYLKQCPSLFEKRKRKKGKGDVAEARLPPPS